MDLEVIVDPKQFVDMPKRYQITDPWHDPVVLWADQIQRKARLLVEDDPFSVTLGYREAGLRVAVTGSSRDALMEAIRSKRSLMYPRVRDVYDDLRSILQRGLDTEQVLRWERRRTTRRLGAKTGEGGPLGPLDY